VSDARQHWITRLRWREGGRRRARTFDRKGDAVRFEADRVRRKQLGHAAVPDDVPLCEFVETCWRLHAVPNLAKSTREFYLLTWTNHIMPRLGDYGVRELTPKRLARFREELEKAGVGTATVRKAMAILQSILSFAVAEELVEFNAAAQADNRVSPILDADARRRYHREWIAAARRVLRRQDLRRLRDDRAARARPTRHHREVNHRLWSWSSTRCETELAKYDVRCSACRRDRLAERQMRHGARGRYEKGCRCEACRQAKSLRNAQYREQHKDKLAETRRPRRNTTRASRSASGIVGVYHVPEASRSKPWRAQISVGKRLIHLGMFATRDEAAAARAAAEQDQRT
jgi:hypothetical protein